MDRRLLGAFAVAAALLLTACGGGGSSATTFTKADSDAIRAMVRDFVAAYNAGDVEKIGTLFAPTASVMPINRSTLRGLDLVKGYYESRVKEEGGTNLAIEPIAIDGQGTLAYVAASFTMALRPPDGSAERHDRGKVVWIVRKLGGQWRFDWQIMSSELPPAAPPAK
jgi:uncharacterized protein (TIGR02246 family)